tara:strand:+ start:63 stop:173 length:111 start_codon:yes stop_codon:yes gene_type:complete
VVEVAPHLVDPQVVVELVVIDVLNIMFVEALLIPTL